MHIGQHLLKTLSTIISALQLQNFLTVQLYNTLWGNYSLITIDDKFVSSFQASWHPLRGLVLGFYI